MCPRCLAPCHCLSQQLQTQLNVPQEKKKDLAGDVSLTTSPRVPIKSNPMHSFSLQEHFLGVMKNQEFLLLPACEVEKLLVSDDMNVPDEETVVSALLSWVQYDSASRQSQLPALLQHVRLPLLKPQVSLPSVSAVSPSVRSSSQPSEKPAVHLFQKPVWLSRSFIYPEFPPSFRDPSSCHRSIHLFTNQKTSLAVSIYLSIQRFLCPSINPSIHPFFHLSIHPSILPFIYPFNGSCVHPSIHPSIHPS
ncbi:kelch-like protein 5 isoform X1, partial [Tachysurus ichikawai]